VSSKYLQVVSRAGAVAFIHDKHYFAPCRIRFEAFARRVDHIDDDAMRAQGAAFAGHSKPHVLWRKSEAFAK
jgi:hypothetical protein